MKPIDNNSNYAIARAAYGSVAAFCRVIGISKPTFWHYCFTPDKVSKKTKGKIAAGLGRALDRIQEDFRDGFGQNR